MSTAKSKNIEKFPDVYKKTAESSNNRLLLLNESLLSTAENDLKDIFESLDFFKASGKTLDLYGAAYNQKRGQLNDEQYRYVILSKIGRNMGNTDYNSILNLITAMFNCDYSEVMLQDMSENGGACVVNLVKMPFSILNKIGFTTKQVKQMIEALLPICVRLEAHNFEGTFEFGGENIEYDEAKGFGNEKQTIGGFLGLLIGEDEEKGLPI